MKDSPIHERAFYLQNTGGVHYDVVLNVSHFTFAKGQSLQNPISVSTPFQLHPCNLEDQVFLCSLLKVPLVVKHNSKELSKPLGKPTKLYRMQGDGNCLFRSLSFLVTGRETYHSDVRQKVVEHMMMIETYLLPQISFSILEEYFAHTRMKNQSAWGTDVEILAASSLLERDIYVCTKVGTTYKWQRFSKSLLMKDLPIHERAFYLQNTGGVHYDVVLNVNFQNDFTLK